MTRDPLHELLQKADSTAGEPTSIDGLADRVLAAAHRRHAVMTVSAIAAVTVALLIGISLWVEWAEPINRPNPLANSIGIQPSLQDQVARLHDDVRQLETQLRVQTMVVARLQERERLQRAQERLLAALHESDPMMNVRSQREQAAATMLWIADREASQGGNAQAASRDYQRILELFGDTGAADVARNRLHSATMNQGDSL